MYTSKVKTYTNKDGDKFTVLEEFPEIDYVLILRNTEFEPFVAAWEFNPEGVYWGQGHYFSSLSDAMKYIMEIKILKKHIYISF